MTETEAGYTIGPGVAQAMIDNGDEPRSDEQFIVLEEGHKISQTYGRDAVYYYYQEDNRVNRLPFDSVVEDIEEPPRVRWDPNLYMAPQYYDWTCSVCSLDWVLRATGLNPNSNREQVTYEIGYPENVNSTYGLMDGSGSQIRRVLRDYGAESLQAWLDFDSVYNLALQTTGQMSGQLWYHWVAIRGVDGPNIWIANSAPGYKGIYDTLSRYDFNRLGGFSVVWLTPPQPL